MGEKFKALLDKHCVWLEDTVKRIDEDLILTKRDKASRSWAVAEALMLTHQITGTSGSMGFNEVSERAALLEEQLKPLEFSEGDDYSQDLEHSIELLRSLKVEADKVSPERSSLYYVNLG